MGTSKGSVPPCPATNSFFDIQQANILISNDSPPRACLADFGFMTMTLEFHREPIAWMGLDPAMMFMSPELLVPSKFGFTESIPTPEADIYAFGMVIHQVCDHSRGYPPFIYIFQVLTGRLPFPGLGMAEIVMNVVQGVRPTKPENASAVGLSDLLWDFVQRCWDGEVKLRPKVAEVVSQLGRATADWDGDMSPCAQARSVASASLELPPDPMSHREFKILTLPWYCPSSNHTGGIFEQSPRRLSQTNSTPTSLELPSDFTTPCKFEILIPP